MKISDRAKIFLPFNALKGFKEALKEQEKIVVAKKTLSNDQLEQLQTVLSILKKGMMIKVEYYSQKDENYLFLEGIVTKIDEMDKYLIVVKEKIYMKDIFSIQIENDECLF